MEDLVDMEEMTDAEVRELDFQSYFRMGLVTKQARLPCSPPRGPLSLPSHPCAS